MLVVVTASGAVPEEGRILNQLFEAGLQWLYFRKLGLPLRYGSKVISAVDPAFRNRIAIRTAADRENLADRFGLHRVHLTETDRSTCASNSPEVLKKAGREISTACHRINDALAMARRAHLVFLSPVFDSISKTDHPGRLEGKALPPHKGNIIALSGVMPHRFPKLIAGGYNGAAMLGYIWQCPELAAKRFKTAQQAWKNALTV